MKKNFYSLLLGIMYVFISYGTAKLFFPNDVSTAMIMLTTLLLVPTLSKLIIFRHETGKSIFRHYKTMMQIFLFLFLGITIGYLILGCYYPESISYQLKILGDQNINENVQKLPLFLSVLTNNIEVILIAFVLSLFYGAGALFLIVRTASVFSSFIIKISSNIEKAALGMFSLHFVPEIFGFLLVAIAGGVLSTAMDKEKIGTLEFRSVVKDSTIILVFAIVVIVVAALIEAFITTNAVAVFK